MSRVHFAQKDVLILTRYLNLQISLFCLSKKPKETNAKIVFIYVRGSWAAGHFGQIHYQAIDVFSLFCFFLVLQIRFATWRVKVARAAVTLISLATTSDES